MDGSSRDLAEAALEFAPGEGDGSDHFIDSDRTAGVAIDKTGRSCDERIVDGKFA